MADDRPVLTLAHSADPDDVFMWWPITGVVDPASGEAVTAPAIDTGRFRYRAKPGDIAAFNRAARAGWGDDITALSVRAWADVAGVYVLTGCGGSFGVGYGPKVVARDGALLADDLARAGVRIAIPGRETSAFLALALRLGLARETAADARFVEMAFDAIIPAVVEGRAEAGLVIHEGQVLFGGAGLGEVVDLGAWWANARGGALPLGVNAVRRDLDARHGAGTVREVAATLRASLAHALANREEALRACVPFATINARRSGVPVPDVATIDRYVGMYVNEYTVEMGERGRRAIERFLREGAEAGLCPPVGPVEAV